MDNSYLPPQGVLLYRPDADAYDADDAKKKIGKPAAQTGLRSMGDEPPRSPLATLFAPFLSLSERIAM